MSAERCGPRTLRFGAGTCAGCAQWTHGSGGSSYFTLGRADILPVDDFGVRNGYRIAFGLDAMPKPKELLARGEAWRPYRTTASWYLWRAADIAKEK